MPQNHHIILHIIMANNKDCSSEKYDQQKWPINGCIDWSTAFLGQKTTDG